MFYLPWNLRLSITIYQLIVKTLRLDSMRFNFLTGFIKHVVY